MTERKYTRRVFPGEKQTKKHSVLKHIFDKKRALQWSSGVRKCFFFFIFVAMLILIFLCKSFFSYTSLSGNLKSNDNDEPVFGNGLPNLVLDIYSSPSEWEIYDNVKVIRIPRVCVSKRKHSEKLDDYVPVVSLDYKDMPWSMQMNIKAKAHSTTGSAHAHSTTGSAHFSDVTTKTRSEQTDFKKFKRSVLLFLKTQKGGGSTYLAATVFHGFAMAHWYFDIALKLPASLWDVKGDNVRFFLLGWEDWRDTLAVKFASLAFGGIDNILPPSSWCTDEMWIPHEQIWNFWEDVAADNGAADNGKNIAAGNKGKHPSGKSKDSETPRSGKSKDSSTSRSSSHTPTSRSSSHTPTSPPHHHKDITAKHGPFMKDGRRGLLLERACGFTIKDLTPKDTMVGYVARDTYPISRHMVNQLEFLDALREEKIPYKTHRLESLTLCEQLKAVATSTVWVGAHGAGLFSLTNNLFNIPIVNLSPRPCRASPVNYHHVMPSTGNHNRNRIVQAAHNYGFWKEIAEYLKDMNPRFNGFEEIQDGWHEPECKYILQQLETIYKANLYMDSGNTMVRYDSNNKLLESFDGYLFTDSKFSINKGMFPLNSHHGLPTHIWSNSYWREASASYFWTNVSLAVQAVKEADPFISPKIVPSPDLCYSDDGTKMLEPQYNYPLDKSKCKGGYVENEYESWDAKTEIARHKYGVATFDPEKGLIIEENTQGSRAREHEGTEINRVYGSVG